MANQTTNKIATQSLPPSETAPVTVRNPRPLLEPPPSLFSNRSDLLGINKIGILDINKIGNLLFSVVAPFLGVIHLTSAPSLSQNQLSFNVKNACPDSDNENLNSSLSDSPFQLLITITVAQFITPSSSTLSERVLASVLNARPSWLKSTVSKAVEIGNKNKVFRAKKL